MLLPVILAGCASVSPLTLPSRAMPATPDEVAERFAYTALAVEATLTLRDDDDLYRVFDGKFDAGLGDSSDPTPITFEFYEQKSDGPSPVVLVLPILNGQKHVVRPFAPIAD